MGQSETEDEGGNEFMLPKSNERRPSGNAGWKSLFCCIRRQDDQVQQLDFCHSNLNDVPVEVFNHERTLEQLFLDCNQITDLPRPLFHCHGLRELRLSDNEIGRLPPAIASLIHLQILDVSKNAITEVPDSIKGCKALTVLDFSVNPLGKLPEGITQLLSLEELYLNDIFLEFLPANFGRLTKLRVLELRENQLASLPKSMSRLTSLHRLDLGQNYFTDLPEVVGSISSLAELWVDGNKLDVLPDFLGGLQNLNHLDASRNGLHLIAPSLGLCKTITDLSLTSNNLIQLPDCIGDLSRLVVLRVDDNHLTSLPETIGRLSSLEELQVEQNQMSKIPSSIGLLRKLHTLLADENLLEELPSELGSCQQLTVLSLRNNKLEVLPPELGQLSKLRVLNLSCNKLLHLPVSILKLPSLSALWLSEAQTKPVVPLQTDTDPVSGHKVLTCFLLPQTPSIEKEQEPADLDPVVVEARSPTHIKFAFDGETERPGRLMRNPTPYPKELKALAKHAQHLQQHQPSSPTSVGSRNSIEESVIKDTAVQKIEITESKVTTTVAVTSATSITSAIVSPVKRETNVTYSPMMSPSIRSETSVDSATLSPKPSGLNTTTKPLLTVFAGAIEPTNSISTVTSSSATTSNSSVLSSTTITSAFNNTATTTKLTATSPIATTKSYTAFFIPVTGEISPTTTSTSTSATGTMFSPMKPIAKINAFTPSVDISTSVTESIIKEAIVTKPVKQEPIVPVTEQSTLKASEPGSEIEIKEAKLLKPKSDVASTEKTSPTTNIEKPVKMKEVDDIKTSSTVDIPAAMEVKQPPPYHVAAAYSKRAAEFNTGLSNLPRTNSTDSGLVLDSSNNSKLESELRENSPGRDSGRGQSIEPLESGHSPAMSNVVEPVPSSIPTSVSKLTADLRQPTLDNRITVDQMRPASVPTSVGGTVTDKVTPLLIKRSTFIVESNQNKVDDADGDLQSAAALRQAAREVLLAGTPRESPIPTHRQSSWTNSTSINANSKSNGSSSITSPPLSAANVVGLPVSNVDPSQQQAKTTRILPPKYHSPVNGNRLDQLNGNTELKSPPPVAASSRIPLPASGRLPGGLIRQTSNLSTVSNQESGDIKITQTPVLPPKKEQDPSNFQPRMISVSSSRIPAPQVHFSQSPTASVNNPSISHVITPHATPIQSRSFIPALNVSTVNSPVQPPIATTPTNNNEEAAVKSPLLGMQGSRIPLPKTVEPNITKVGSSPVSRLPTRLPTSTSTPGLGVKNRLPSDGTSR